MRRVSATGRVDVSRNGGEVYTSARPRHHGTMTTTKTLSSHVGGAWVSGKGKLAQLVNPTTEEVLAETSTEGVDMAAAVTYARDVGGKALRALSFKERGEALRKVSRAIHAHRDELIALGIANAGNTRGDAKFDIDGASATLAAYADLGTELGDTRLLVDGEPSNIGRSSKLTGQHVWTPREGVAVHINAFNFPAWGLAEKAAVAILAGVPVISKPATSTALMAHRLMEIIVTEDLLPKGALSFLAGSTNDLVDHLDHQDVLAFTGSGAVGAQLRGSKGVVARSVRVNVEADSLNAAILGPDAEPGSETFDLFVRDVVRDVVQKAGQKCTAIRRAFVPKDRLRAVREAIIERLADVKVCDPSRD
ncbi:MAG: 3,4-dehydroadipyl-CoA semialdehyde dehydrogenase, partial [Polyangiales bacterium]